MHRQYPPMVLLRVQIHFCCLSAHRHTSTAFAVPYRANRRCPVRSKCPLQEVPDAASVSGSLVRIVLLRIASFELFRIYLPDLTTAVPPRPAAHRIQDASINYSILCPGCYTLSTESRLTNREICVAPFQVFLYAEKRCGIKDKAKRTGDTHERIIFR
ncbi:hypothetical protein PLICRDRAFT_404259 [Plicaturopsis crispa FD-325 SS-3]|nr:hypothetical protein PLICRDRAFT_404259 [Plicaturopsis crispa FD-325 SS-3]